MKSSGGTTKWFWNCDGRPPQMNNILYWKRWAKANGDTRFGVNPVKTVSRK